MSIRTFQLNGIDYNLKAGDRIVVHHTSVRDTRHVRLEFATSEGMPLTIHEDGSSCDDVRLAVTNLDFGPLIGLLPLLTGFPLKVVEQESRKFVYELQDK
jgi:hypothetical protein